MSFAVATTRRSLGSVRVAHTTRALTRSTARDRGRSNAALDAAPNNSVVVVYPNTAANWAAFNPNASYFENVIVHSNIKLQGVGAGGPGVPGSSIDGSSFWAAGPNDADGSLLGAVVDRRRRRCCPNRRPRAERPGRLRSEHRWR